MGSRAVLKIERPRRATVRGVRDRDTADQVNTLNLQGPRTGRLNLNTLLKGACAAAVKRAAELVQPDSSKPGFYEGPEIRALLDRVGQVMEMNDPDFFARQKTNRAAWVLDTAKNPWQTAAVLKDFGRLTSASIFEDIATMIAGHQPRGQLGVGRGESKEQRLQRFANPDRPVEAGTQTVGQSQQALSREHDKTTLKLEAVDQAGNLIDLAIPNFWISLLANQGPTVLGAYVAMTGESVDAGFGEYEHAGLKPFLPLANQTMELVEARESLAKLEKTQKEGGPVARSALEAAQRRIAVAEQGVVEESKRVPARQTKELKEPTADILSGVASTASALGNVVNSALMPTYMPGMSFWARTHGAAAVKRATAERSLKAAALKDTSKPEIIGNVLMSGVGEFPAGTELTPEVVEKIRASQGDVQVVAIPPQSYADLVQLYQDTEPNAQQYGAAGVQSMLEVAGAHITRSALRDIVASGARLSANTPAPLRWLMQSAQTQLSQSSVAQRIAATKLGQKAGAVARYGATAIGQLAQKIPGVVRVTQAVDQLARLGRLPKGLAPATGRLASLARLGGLGAKLLTGGAVIGAGTAAYDAITAGGEEAMAAHERSLQDLAASDANTPWIKQVGRDLLAVPEALVWDTTYAKARLGEFMASRGIGDPHRAALYREAVDRARFDHELAKQYDGALADVEKMLPGMSPDRYHELASEMAMNRAGTIQGLIPLRRQTSEYEYELSNGLIRQLPPENQARALQILREVGPEAFHNAFFFGEGIPDKLAWDALHKGLQNQVPDRLAELNVSWRNPVEERMAAAEASRQKVQQAAAQAKETQQVQQASQQAKQETQQSVVQSQQRAQQSEEDYIARGRQQAEMREREAVRQRQGMQAREAEQRAFMASLESNQARVAKQDRAFAAAHPPPVLDPEPGTGVDSAPVGRDNPVTAATPAAPKPPRLDVTKYLPKTPAPI